MIMFTLNQTAVDKHSKSHEDFDLFLLVSTLSKYSTILRLT